MLIDNEIREDILSCNGHYIFDFVSSRYTEKNTLARAIRSEFKKQINLQMEYENLIKEFKMKPYLEELFYETQL